MHFFSFASFAAHPLNPLEIAPPAPRSNITHYIRVDLYTKCCSVPYGFGANGHLQIFLGFFTSSDLVFAHSTASLCLPYPRSYRTTPGQCFSALSIPAKSWSCGVCKSSDLEDISDRLPLAARTRGQS